MTSEQRKRLEGLLSEGDLVGRYQELADAFTISEECLNAIRGHITTLKQRRDEYAKAITDNLKVAYAFSVGDTAVRQWILDFQPTRNVWFRAFQGSAWRSSGL